MAAALFLGAVVLASTSATFVLYSQTDDFDRRAATLIERFIEYKFGEALTVSDVEITFGSPAIELRNARLWHIDTGDTIAQVARIRAPLVLRDGGLRLGRLTIDDPSILLHIDAGTGLREFKNLADPDPNATPIERLPWDSLEVTSGSFKVITPDGELVLTHLEATPTDGPVTDISADVHFNYKELEQQTKLDWSGVVLGPDRIEIPDLSFDVPAVQIEGSASYPLGGELDVRLSVSPDVEELNVLVEPPRALHGDYDLDLRVAGKPNDPRAEAVILARGVELQLPGISWPILTYRMGDAVIVADGDKTGLNISSARMDWADGVITLDGRLDADGTVSDLHVVGENLSLETALVELESAPTPWVDLRLDAELDLHGAVKPFALDGDFDLSILDFEVGNGPISRGSTTVVLGIPDAHATGSIHFDKDHVVLDSKDIVAQNTRGSALVDIGFKYKGPLDLRADLYEVDLSDIRPLGGSELRGTGRLHGRFKGPFNKVRFEGEGNIRDFSVGGIDYADHLVSVLESDMRTLSLIDARAVKGSSRYNGAWSMDFKEWTMDTDIDLSAGRVEDIVGLFVDVEGMTGDMTGNLKLHGPFYDLDGDAAFAFADVDLFGERFPNGTAHAWMDHGLFTLDDLRILRNRGREGLILRGSVNREYALNMELVGDGFDLSTMNWLDDFNAPISGKAFLRARIDNTLYDPAVHGRVAWTDVEYGGTPIDNSQVEFKTVGGVAQYHGKLAGGTVRIRGTLGLWDEQPYELDGFFAKFPAHVFHATAADGKPIQAHVSGSLKLDGHFGEEWSPVALSADVEQVDMRWRHHELTNPEPWHYEQEGEIYTLQNMKLQGGATQVVVNASNTTGVPELSGSGTVDLDLMRIVVPYLTRSEGTGDMKLTMKGKGADRDTLLDVTAHASLIEHESFPGQFEDMTIELLANDSKYNLLSATGNLGGGTIDARGRILAEGWVPARYELVAHARDAQLQWVDYLPPAIGDADVTFDGPTDQLLLSGEVQIGEMVFSDRIDWEDWVIEFRDEMLVNSATADQESMFALDMHVVADDTVTLRNNVAEGTVSADLRFIGDTARPGMIGWARTSGGLATIQDREFQIDRGEVRWRDPWTWDPQLDIDLVTDIRSVDRPYRVNYRVIGPFSDWRTLTRSEPALSQADINALLWFGVTADDLEGTGQLYSAIGQAAADMVLADLFVSGQLQGGDEVAHIVDRVDIATGVNTRGEYSPDPRLIVERRFEELGDTTATYEWNMVETDSWYLRLDNRISDDVSFSAWYATKQRGTSSSSGAVGADVRLRKEWE